MGPTATVGGGGSERPFTIKNLEAPSKFSGIKHPITTTWLTEISCWIHLSKVPEIDQWDVLATHMIGGALTLINAKLRVVEELGVQPWPTWQVFTKANKA